MPVARAAAANASLWRGAIFIVLFMASSCICTGRPSDASQTRPNEVANLMNNRPRKTLGWRTPAEAMADEIAAFKSTVELDV
jgi:hypothetical protein